MANELILVVDDEEMVCRQAELALRRSNYRTKMAFNGQQALAIIRETPPDLLLTDIRMPDIDGLQLFTTARKIQPDLITVLMTGHGTIDIAIKALQLGVSGFLQKPFTGSELENAVEDAFEKSRTVREAVRSRLLSPLLEARRFLGAELNLPHLYNSLVETTAREISAEYCGLFIVEEAMPTTVKSTLTIQPTISRPNLRQVAAFVNPDTKVFSARNFPAIKLAGRALEVERTLSLRRTMTGDLSENNVPGVVIAVPMITNGRSMGVIMAGRGQPENTFSTGERELLEILAGQLANILDNRRLYQVLREREERLRTFIGRFVSAQEEELKQFANRLQEELLPLLTTSRQSVQTYLQKVRPASDELLQTEKKLQTAINTTKHLNHDLRPANLDEFGLTAALRQHVKDLNSLEHNSNAKYLTFRQEGPEIPRLDSAIEIALFRACQEAVTNALHHAAGSPTELAVRVQVFRNRPIHLQIQIRDSGKGFDWQGVKEGDTSKYIGLLAMQERVTLVGGNCQIESAPGKGTTVTIEYPLPDPLPDIT